MRRKTWQIGASLALVAAMALSAGRALSHNEAADGTHDDWEHRFGGHEMWLSSLDDALARAAKEKKPLLIDFYSHT